MASGEGVAMLARDPATGVLSSPTVTGANTVALAIAPGGSHLYAAEYPDRIRIYGRDAVTGGLRDAGGVKNGEGGGVVKGLGGVSGLAIPADGKHLYAVGKWEASLTSFTRADASGGLAFVQTSIDDMARVDGLSGPDELVLSPDDRNIYVAATQDHGVGVFSRDASTGVPTFQQLAREPCTDCDADRYPALVDCNDADPAIHPGATDVPGNTVDEDCSGTSASYQRLGSTFLYEFDASRRRTVFTSLYVRRVEAGSSIRLTCSGRGCLFKGITRRVGKDVKSYNLSSKVRRSKLRPGARLEIRVTKPETIGVVRRLVVRAGRRPKLTDLCLKPGARQPTRCT
jgi:hypothetical protein